MCMERMALLGMLAAVQFRQPNRFNSFFIESDAAPRLGPRGIAPPPPTNLLALSTNNPPSFNQYFFPTPHLQLFVGHSNKRLTDITAP